MATRRVSLPQALELVPTLTQGARFEAFGTWYDTDEMVHDMTGAPLRLAPEDEDPTGQGWVLVEADGQAHRMRPSPTNLLSVRWTIE